MKAFVKEYLSGGFFQFWRCARCGGERTWGNAAPEKVELQVDLPRAFLTCDRCHDTTPHTFLRYGVRQQYAERAV